MLCLKISQVPIPIRLSSDIMSKEHTGLVDLIRQVGCMFLLGEVISYPSHPSDSEPFSSPYIAS